MDDLYHLTQRPIVFLDFETTGLRPYVDRVIEIAAIRWDERGRRTYAQLVNPGISIPPVITRKTGITQEMVNNGVPITIAFKEFYASFLADEPILVAHNARFDLSFLDYELKRLGFPPFNGPVACTLHLSRKYIVTHNHRHRLVDVAASLDLTPAITHRALADAETCEQIFLAMWPYIAQEKRKPWRRRPRRFTTNVPRRDLTRRD